MPADIWKHLVVEIAGYLKRGDDKSRFMHWPPIEWTMVAGPGVIASLEDEHVARTRPDLPSRVGESWVGDPPRSLRFPMTSCNMIRMIYHLGRYLDWMGASPAVAPLNQWASILEYGGGFGAMHYLARKLGFVGSYVSFDLPILIELQTWYLRHSLGRTYELCTDLAAVKQPALVIATSSLAEALPAEQDAFFAWPAVRATNYFLITDYGSLPGAVSRPALCWERLAVPHPSGNQYLFARPREDP